MADPDDLGAEDTSPWMRVVTLKSPPVQSEEPAILPATQPKLHSRSARGYLNFSTPSDADSDTLWALEPRLDCPSKMKRNTEEAWPPPLQIQSVDHAVRVSNATDSPILLKNGEQLCLAQRILPV